MKVQVIRKKSNYFGKYKRRTEDEARYRVEVGFPSDLSDKTYPNGMSVNDVAYLNNFGTKRIPARNFMDVAFIRQVHELKGYRENLIKLMMRGKISSNEAARRLGREATKILKDTIADFNTPGNSDITIYGGWMRTDDGVPFYVQGKGFDDPLIHTGMLWNSATWKIT